MDKDFGENQRMQTQILMKASTEMIENVDREFSNGRLGMSIEENTGMMSEMAKE